MIVVAAFGSMFIDCRFGQSVYPRFPFFSLLSLSLSLFSPPPVPSQLAVDFSRLVLSAFKSLSFLINSFAFQRHYLVLVSHSLSLQGSFVNGSGLL